MCNLRPALVSQLSVLKWNPSPYALSAISACMLIMIAVARIVATYPMFCQTHDEPAHISRGYLWLKGYAYIHPLHPPLAPIAFATGPVLSGVDAAPTGDKWIDGNSILYSADYARTLTLARMGNLVFFIWAAVAVWMWCRNYFDPHCAFVAVLIFTMLPPVLAHAGLATTDMAITASLCTSVWLFLKWLDQCTLARSLALGISVGLTLLSKLSAVIYLPGCFIAVLISRGPSDGTRRSFNQRCWYCLAVYLCACNVVWAGYRYSVGSIYLPDAPAGEEIGEAGLVVNSGPVVRWLLEVPVPAPEFFRGLVVLIDKNDRGHAPYFLGSVSQQGSLVFFPAVLIIKTPIAFVCAFCLGSFVSFGRGVGRHARVPFACSIAVLDMAMTSRINLGVRHILPLYPMLSICAALGVSWLWRRRPICSRASPTDSPATIETAVRRLPGCAGLTCSRMVVIALAFWGATESTFAHPDYLAFFNRLAGRHPEEIVVDSDLDWGQDLGRLAAELSRRNIDHIHIAYFGTADKTRHGLPDFSVLPTHQRVSGYVAISMTLLKTSEGYDWLNEHRPIAIIGKSILLFDIRQ